MRVWIYSCAVMMGIAVASWAYGQERILCGPTVQCGVIWDQNTEADMSHYYLYWRLETDLYDTARRYRVAHPLPPTSPVPDVMAAVDSIMAMPDGVYFFHVTAVDLGGNESPPSNEISLVVDRVAPAPPTGLRAE